MSYIFKELFYYDSNIIYYDSNVYIVKILI